MIGGGFLAQMNETLQKNRAMLRASLGKKDRKPFEYGEYKLKHHPIADTTKKLNPQERETLIAKAREQDRKELIKKIILLTLVLLIIAFALWALPIVLNSVFDPN